MTLAEAEAGSASSLSSAVPTRWERAGRRRPGAIAMLLRADAPHPFERGAEGERGAVTHLLSHRADGCFGFAQQVGGQGQTPSGEKLHGWFSNQVVKPPGQRRAGDAGLGGEAGQCPGVGGVAVHGAQGAPDDRHIGQLYELTGPRLLTLAQAAAELSSVVGREVRYQPVTAVEYASELVTYGMPQEEAIPISELIAEVLDGRNEHLTDGVQRALGRLPRDFAEYARNAAATGVWNLEAKLP